MSLQDTYYLTNIIVMCLSMVLLTVLVISVFYIMKKFSQLSDNVNRRIDDIGRIVDDPGDVAADIEHAAAGEVIGVETVLRHEFRHGEAGRTGANRRKRRQR